jgi:hypothetical protein
MISSSKSRNERGKKKKGFKLKRHANEVKPFDLLKKNA